MYLGSFKSIDIFQKGNISSPSLTALLNICHRIQPHICVGVSCLSRDFYNTHMPITRNVQSFIFISYRMILQPRVLRTQPMETDHLGSYLSSNTYCSHDHMQVT